MPGQSQEQEIAEAEVECFKQELGPFVVAAEVTRMPMVFTDARQPDNRIIFANDSFISLVGYDRAEVLGKSLDFLVADGADPGALAEIRANFEDGAAGGPEIRCTRKDGSEFWARVCISPVRDGGDEIVQHFASFVDLTRHKEDQARSARLIDELNHRVRNTLSAVQSIVSQAFRKSSDPAATLEFILSRIAALSRFHTLLDHEDWGGAGLRDVVTEALTPFRAAKGPRDRFVVEGDNIHLPPKMTLALGIALHELALNAVTHGAFSDDVGRVRVSWTIQPKAEGDRLLLSWREAGGPPVSAPSQKGFGARVIEGGLAHELQATVHLGYSKDGLMCTIDMPAPGLVVMDKLLSGRRVLVVEDEMLVLMETEAMLADLGCELVTAAATVDKAVDLIQTQRFDAALLDVNLNGARSDAVADALVAQGVPFAFATGYGGGGLRDGDRDRPILVKPFRSERLEEVLTGLLSQGVAAEG